MNSDKFATNSTFGFKPRRTLEKSLRKMKAAEKAREDRSAKLRDEYIDRVKKSTTRDESEDIVIAAARMKEEILESDFLEIALTHSIKWIVSIKPQFTNQSKESLGGCDSGMCFN